LLPFVKPANIAPYRRILVPASAGIAPGRREDAGAFFRDETAEVSSISATAVFPLDLRVAH
jgi:hypothetical protein